MEKSISRGLSEHLLTLTDEEGFISAEACRSHGWGRITLPGPLNDSELQHLELVVRTKYESDLLLFNLESPSSSGINLLEGEKANVCSIMSHQWMFHHLACDSRPNFALILAHHEYWDLAGSLGFLHSLCPDFEQARDDFLYDIESEPLSTYRDYLRAHSDENTFLCEEAGRVIEGKPRT